ncbi:MAG: protein-export chaperone SecB [Gammaproteobacteria bacterium]|nr:protein-export chaperone SecB [Gammaproteobacteria bacterium]
MTEQVQNQFNIQKIYLKDSSFESPESPASFTFEKWEPKVDLNMNNTNNKLNDVSFEVVLSLTATVKNEDKTAFLVEVQQAGIFAIQGVEEADVSYLLGSQCMTILFPYAREAISDLVTKGGFPPLLLNPVNFDALYMQHIEQQKKASEESEVKH